MKNSTGVIERAAVILRTIAAQGSLGIRLRDLADVTGISRPSVHRILKELSELDFVTQLPNKRYALGTELYLLGMSAPSPEIDLNAISQVIQQLADLSGDTVYFGRRQIDGVRYLLRAEGNHPVKALMVDVGQAKPFNSSYAGLALLAGMSDYEQETALSRTRLDTPEGWHEEIDVVSLLREAMTGIARHGYLSGASIVYPGIAGMAAPVPQEGLPPMLAVTISATESRLTPERILELAPHLLEAVRRISHIVSAESKGKV